MASVRERVRAGATLLDERVVGWAEQVRVDLLDMFDCLGCVLGQLFAHKIDRRNGIDSGYKAGCKILGLNSDEGVWSESAALGFHAAISVERVTFFALPAYEQEKIRSAIRAEYAQLRTAWLAEIAARCQPIDAGEDETGTEAEKAAWAGMPL